MDNMIKGLVILRRHPGGEAGPGVARDVYTEETWLEVGVNPGLVTPEDLAALAVLGFVPSPAGDSFFFMLSPGLTCHGRSRQYQRRADSDHRAGSSYYSFS